MRFRFFVLFIAMAAPGACVSADKVSVTLEHKVTLSQPGTKSESRHGFLYLNGVVLPDCFRLFYHDGKLYRFSQREYMWGDDGYFPASETFSLEASREQLSPSDLAYGFYAGKNAKLGTPANWVYVEWSGGAAFVDPGRIKELIDYFKIAPIPRSLMEQLFKE